MPGHLVDYGFQTTDCLPFRLGVQVIFTSIKSAFMQPIPPLLSKLNAVGNGVSSINRDKGILHPLVNEAGHLITEGKYAV